MINLDLIGIIAGKVRTLMVIAALNGLIFVCLGVAIIFLPQIIQYLFVVGFVLVGLFSIVVAVKLSHVLDLLMRFELFSGKKINKK